jgi:hypothetical protein
MAVITDRVAIKTPPGVRQSIKDDKEQSSSFSS